MAAAQKLQSTYRAGAKTPDYIIDAINEGIKQTGSFPKFVDSLVEEHLALNGDVPITLDDGANVDTSALEKKLDKHTDEFRKMYEDILKGLQNVAPSAEGNVSIELPDNIATSDNLKDMEAAIKSYIDKSVSDTIDSVVSQIDVIISNLTSKIAEIESGKAVISVDNGNDDVSERKSTAEPVMVQDDTRTVDTSVMDPEVSSATGFAFADDGEAEKVALGLNAIMGRSETESVTAEKAPVSTMTAADLTIPPRREHVPSDMSEALSSFADKTDAPDNDFVDNKTDGVLDDGFFSDDEIIASPAPTKTEAIPESVSENGSFKDEDDDDVFSNALDSDPNVLLGFKALFG